VGELRERGGYGSGLVDGLEAIEKETTRHYILE